MSQIQAVYGYSSEHEIDALNVESAEINDCHILYPQIKARLIKRIQTLSFIVPNRVLHPRRCEIVHQRKEYLHEWKKDKSRLSNKGEIDDCIHSLNSLFIVPQQISNPYIIYISVSPSLLIASNSVIFMHNIHTQNMKRIYSKLSYFVTGIKEKWRNGINIFASKLYTDTDKLQLEYEHHINTVRLKSLLQDRLRIFSHWRTHLFSAVNKFRYKIINTTIATKDICSTSNEQDQHAADIQPLQNKVNNHGQVIRYSIMTEDILNNTDWSNVIYDRGPITLMSMKISKKALIKECHLSRSNLIPIDMNENVKHWPDFLKIVNIKSEGVYLCVRYGYDKNELFVVSVVLRDELPNDLTTLIIQYCMELQIKSFILEPMAAMNIAGSILSFQEMRKYNKWVARIQIMDFDHDLHQIADAHGIDIHAMKRCFDENEVDYSYLHSHSRKDFTELLHGYGISAGKTTKIFRAFSGKQEIEVFPFYPDY